MSTPFNCAEAFRRLNDYLDHELTPEEVVLVEAHLKECETCSREFRFESELLDGLKAKANATAMPEDLRRRLQETIDRARE